MIVYTEFLDATVHVIAMPSMESSCTTTITCTLDFDFSHKIWKLSRKHIALIDTILDAKTVIIFKSAQDRDKFIALIRRHSDFRVCKNTVLLPSSVVANIEQSSPVTPSILTAALAADGIKTAADLRKLKSVSSA